MNWKKVYNCEHEWSGTYYDGGNCWTPKCDWHEKRCIKCGVYSIKCGCGFMNGLSGWPEKRHRNYLRKKEMYYGRKIITA